MKGRTLCPQCKHEFVVEVPDIPDKHEIFCPKCNYKFAIRCNKEECSNVDDESGWEEHGEPRKTILSSVKTKTRKPHIASFMLLTAFILGIFNAVLESNEPLILPHLPLLSDIITTYLFSAMVIVFSVCALIATITSFKRLYFQITLIFSILGIFSFGFFVGLALCIAAVFLVYTSRDEFENGAKGKEF